MAKRIEFSELIAGKTALPCERCGEPTVWRRPRQRTKGFCADHSVGDGLPEEAIRAVLKTFPKVEMSEPKRHFMERGEYVKWVQVTVTRRRIINGALMYAGRYTTWTLPLDAGPCRDCGAVIRAYGSDAEFYCGPCAGARGLI